MQNSYKVPKLYFGRTLQKIISKGLLNERTSLQNLSELGKRLDKNGLPQFKHFLNELKRGDKTAIRRKGDSLLKGIQELDPRKGKVILKGLGFSDRSAEKLLQMDFAQYQQRQQANIARLAQARASRSAQRAAETAAAETAAAGQAIEAGISANRWLQLKNWIKQHPGLVIGGLGLGLGTGPGRWVLGNTLKYTQIDPSTGQVPFSDESASEDNTEYLEINGKKIPISRSQNGTFVPVSEQEKPEDIVSDPSDVDALIDQALKQMQVKDKESVNGASDQAAEGYQDSSGDRLPQEMPQIDQQAINDLFEDDSWL